jgi:3-deoxy-manno-octulosonate cytidylyltransferase (CMP-KDO synthetase)
VQVSLPSTLTESSVVAIVPARYHSSRFPGKPLADLGGRPMIVHVYQRARTARAVDAVIVATDDARIAEAVTRVGGTAWMTRPDHLSGTDRLAEVASQLPCRLVVNVQGDEPLLDPAAIDAAVAPLLADPSLQMSTICRPLASLEEFLDPNVVKVVTGDRGQALYFSRSPVPFPRADGEAGPPASVPSVARAHVGLYVYRRDTLLRLAALPPATSERVEALEQLRALAHGISIQVIDTTHASVGVDTPDDLDRVRHLLLEASRP